jgi:hypothetical protein
MYKDKYLKYKNKYLNLKKIQKGGECDVEPLAPEDRVDILSYEDLFSADVNELMRFTMRGRCFNIVSLYDWHIIGRNRSLAGYYSDLNNSELRSIRIQYGTAIAYLLQFYILDRNRRLPGMNEDLPEHKLQDIKDRFKKFKSYTFCTFESNRRRYNGLSINHNKIIPFNDIYHVIPYRECVELPNVTILDVGAVVILRNIQDPNLNYVNNSIGVIVKNIDINNKYSIIILPTIFWIYDRYVREHGVKLLPAEAVTYMQEYRLQNADNIIRIPELKLSANQLELL